MCSQQSTLLCPFHSSGLAFHCMIQHTFHVWCADALSHTPMDTLVFYCSFHSPYSSHPSASPSSALSFICLFAFTRLISLPSPPSLSHSSSHPLSFRPTTGKAPKKKKNHAGQYDSYQQCNSSQTLSSMVSLILTHQEHYKGGCAE